MSYGKRGLKGKGAIKYFIKSHDFYLDSPPVFFSANETYRKNLLRSYGLKTINFVKFLAHWHGLKFSNCVSLYKHEFLEKAGFDLEPLTEMWGTNFLRYEDYKFLRSFYGRKLFDQIIQFRLLNEDFDLFSQKINKTNNLLDLWTVLDKSMFIDLYSKYLKFKEEKNLWDWKDIIGKKVTIPYKNAVLLGAEALSKEIIESCENVFWIWDERYETIFDPPDINWITGNFFIEPKLSLTFDLTGYVMIQEMHNISYIVNYCLQNFIPYEICLDKETENYKIFLASQALRKLSIDDFPSFEELQAMYECLDSYWYKFFKFPSKKIDLALLKAHPFLLYLKKALKKYKWFNFLKPKYVKKAKEIIDLFETDKSPVFILHPFYFRGGEVDVLTSYKCEASLNYASKEVKEYVLD